MRTLVLVAVLFYVALSFCTGCGPGGTLINPDGGEPLVVSLSAREQAQLDCFSAIVSGRADSCGPIALDGGSVEVLNAVIR